MKAVFAGVFLALLLLTAVAWRIQPETHQEGKIPLTWVSDDNPARREQIALFNQANPDYDLRLDPGNTGMEKVIVQSLAGVGPDLFDCYNGFQLSSYVRSGIACDVTDELAKHGVDVARDAWAGTHPTVIHEGRAYGFPTNAAANAIWINKDLFDRARIPYPEGPWTWEEFIPLAKRLTKRDANGRPQQFGFLCDWWNWQQFILQWGGRIYSEDGTRCVVDSPEAVAAVQFLHDLIYVHRIMPSPVEEAAMATSGGWGSGTITLFRESRAAMALGGRWWLCTLRDAEKKLRLGAVECPHGPLRVFRGYGRATLVNAKSPRLEHAIRFLLYEAGKTYNDLINAQADALAPVIRFAYTPEYLHNPEYPEEDFNVVWREAQRLSVPDQVSPFVNGQRAERILGKQMDLVKNDSKPVADALKTAAREINEEIQRTLKRDPELRARYQKLTQGGSQ